MLPDQFEMFLVELRAIRSLLVKVTNPIIVATGVPEPKTESMADMMYRLSQKVDIPRAWFTLHQPLAHNDGEKRLVGSIGELERYLNRQKLCVDWEKTCGKGYAVYEPSYDSSMVLRGKWLVGYLDRPFATAAVTH